MSSLALSLGSGIIDILGAIIPGTFNCIKEAKKEADRKNKEKKEALEKAREMDRNDISDKLYNEILRISGSSLILEVMYLSIAKSTKEWIDYTGWYLTDDKAVLIKADKAEQRFVNSVAKLAGYDKEVYPDAGYIDLERYDARKANIGYELKFLLLTDELTAKYQNPEFVSYWKASMARRSMYDPNTLSLEQHDNGLRGRYDDQGLYHPVFFTADFNDNQVVTDKRNGIPEVAFNKFESALQFMVPNDHWYNVDDSGCYTLMVSRADAMGAIDTYILDDGSIMGGSGVYILANMLTDAGVDTIFVEINKHPSIASKVLASRFYQLSSEEINEVSKDYLRTVSLYHSIDFSNTPWFDTLDFQSKITLEKTLSACANIANEFGDVRLRFSNFENVNKFTLSSDNLTKSPLAYNGTTATDIASGLVLYVNNNVITKSIGGQSGSQYRLA